MTKDFYNINQFTNIFCTTKQHFILHCQQTSMSVFLIFIQSEYHWALCCVCLCHGGSL